MNRFFALAMLLATGFCGTAAAEGVPQSVKVQGYLSDRGGGSPVPANGVYTMTFAIYDDAAGGVALATVGPLAVTVTAGVYEATLPADASVFAGASRFLEITVNAEVLTPRLAINSAPYALRSDSAVKAETVAPGSVGAAGLAPGAVTAPAIAPGAVTSEKLGMTCAEGQILVRSGGEWACGVIPPAPRVCAVGAYLSCYPAPMATLGIGPCHAGTSTCKPDQTGFTDCQDAVVPAEEACDGVDNDCDGQVDEGGACSSATCGDGVLEGAEACDDGNNKPGDGCSQTCQVEAGFQCTGAPSVCTALCGDGQRLGGEQCDGADLGGQSCQTVGFPGGSLACHPDCTFDTSGCTGCPDADGDGYPAASCGGTDCNDANPNVHPGAVEICDGLDNNCDGVIDEGGVCSCPDADRDGFPSSACGGTDCDDANPKTFPGAPELCDGRDNDCDGLIDEGAGCGFPFCGNGVINPGEQCDGQDLGGQTCQTLGFPGGVLSCNPGCTFNTTGCHTGCQDRDGDGYPDRFCGGSDCDDANPTIHPGAVEICDGRDDDCDGLVDEGGVCGGGAVCGNGVLEGAEACDDGNTKPFDGCSDLCQVETGFQCTGTPSVCTTICGDGLVRGGEVCDGADLGGRSCESLGYTGGTLTCSGSCTLDTSGCTGCVDADHDGFASTTCGGPDCDDANPGVFPGAPETCDGLDNNCDGAIDEGGACGTGTCGNGAIDPGEQCDGQDFGGQTCFSLGYPGGALSCNPNCTLNTGGCFFGCLDADGDGHRSSACGGDDCNDGDPAVFPGAVETCNGLDDNCNGLIDEGGVCGAAGCGNGILEGAEACDDGNSSSGDGCSSSCLVEAGYQCTGGPSTCTTICGDGLRRGGEQCDGDDLGGQTCQSNGFSGGSLSCSSDCSLDYNACTP